MIEEIYRLFLSCPTISGALVFHDNIYQGVLLKKDLERALAEKSENVLDSVVVLPPSQIEEFLFSAPPRNKTEIPCLSLHGEILESILYEEFISEFFPEDYRLRFSLGEVLRFYEYPLLVVNRFKTVVYTNIFAENLFSQNPLGRRLGELLEEFHMKTLNDRILVMRGSSVWIMFVSSSHTPGGLFYLYQFIEGTTEGKIIR